MIRRPDPSDTLVDTGDGLVGAFQLLAAGLLEQIGLHGYLMGLEIAHADRLLSSVDVVASENRMLARSWGNMDFDLGVFLSKEGEVVRQVVTGVSSV